MKKQTKVSEELIGKYINYYGYSDIEPVGKIVGIKSKTIVYVARVFPSENKTLMKWVAGGFAGHCINQHAQAYDYTIEHDNIIEVRISAQYLKTHRIQDNPRKFYDYNF